MPTSPATARSAHTFVKVGAEYYVARVVAGSRRATRVLADGRELRYFPMRRETSSIRRSRRWEFFHSDTRI